MSSEITFPEVVSNFSDSRYPKVLSYHGEEEDENGTFSIATNNETYFYTTIESNSTSSLEILEGKNELAVEFETSTVNNSVKMSLFEDEWWQDSHQLFEIPVSMIILLFLLYGAICVTALVGNALVLGLSMCSGRMRTVTNLFIANLALSDIIIGLFTIPFQFQAALLQRWDLPHFLCAFCPFVQVLSVNVSVFTLSAIAVDRYRAVMHPLGVQASKKKASWLILSIWIVGFLLALPTEFDYKVTHITTDKGVSKPFCTNVWMSPEIRMYYNQSIVVLQYFLPLCIITVAYIRMGNKLWKNQSPGNKEQSRDAVLLRNKMKVIKMLFLVVILFSLCWFPLQTYNFVQYIFPSVNTFYYINVIWFTFHLLAMSNSCCNPFVYAIYNEKFRREFQAKMGCLPKLSTCCWQKDETVQQRETTNNTNDSVGDTSFTELPRQHHHQRQRRSNNNSGTSEKSGSRIRNDSANFYHHQNNLSSSVAEETVGNRRSAAAVSLNDTLVTSSNDGAGGPVVDVTVHTITTTERQLEDCRKWSSKKHSWSFPFFQGGQHQKCRPNSSTSRIEEDFV